MSKKSLTPLVLACLVLTGPALALANAEPLPPQTVTNTPMATASDMRVGINKDGSLRPLTAEEQLQLDGQNTKRAAASLGKARVDGGKTGSQPRTEREAMTTLKAAPNGMRSMAVPEDMMSTLSVTRSVDGKLQISESNDSHGRPTQGAANE